MPPGTRALPVLYHSAGDTTVQRRDHCDIRISSVLVLGAEVEVSLVFLLSWWCCMCQCSPGAVLQPGREL